MCSARFEIRTAREDDVDAVMDLTEAVAAERRWIGTEPGFDREQRAAGFGALVRGESQGCSFVAVADGHVIGHAVLLVTSYGVADLGMMVAEGWRGRGVGHALLSELVGWARAAEGVHKVALQHWPHNEAAHRLYRRHGFEVEGRLRRHYRRESGEAWDAIVMGLLVDSSVPECSIPDDGPRAPRPGDG